MTRAPTNHMAHRESLLKQIRLLNDDLANTDGPPLLRANKLCYFVCLTLDISCSNFFTPRNDPNVIIINLNSREDKDSLISKAEFLEKATFHKFKILPPPREADESITFVDNLPDSFFLFWETDE